MAAALKSMQDSDDFRRNQNARALKAGVATIADKTKRNKVFKAAMALLKTNGDNVKAALAAAMAAEGVPDADPAHQLASANTARTAFDTIAASADFDVGPGMVVRQLVMDKVGLTEAGTARQKEYEAAAAARDTRPDNDPGRKTDMAEVERLQKECADIRPEILKMEELKTASYDAFTGGEDNRLLRAYEYTLTALSEKNSDQTTIKRLQDAEKVIFKTEIDGVVATMKTDPAVTQSDSDINNIGNILFRQYATLFKEGTQHAYDASIQADEVSADGNSSRGGFYLYDIRGIPSEADWIKTDDAKKYQALVKGTMMLAWKAAYGDHKNPAMQDTARLMAEQLGEKIASDGFVTSTVNEAKQTTGKDSSKPWQVQAGGVAEHVFEVVGERASVATTLGPAPATSKELFQQVGNQPKILWDGDASLRAAADEDPEVATVSAGNRGVHIFSLTPGDPKLRAILESSDVNAAIAAFEHDEKAKWDGAPGTISVTSREEVEAFMREYGMEWGNTWYGQAWNSLDTNAFPKTGKGVIDSVTGGLSPAEKPGFESSIGGAVAQQMILPTEPAKLQEKLEKVAGKLGVAPDMVAAVTKRAKDALDTKDAARAAMGDIRDEIARAMSAEGIDASSVDQKAVNDALRDPVGIIFADSNWGSAEHRVKYAMVVNPVRGKIEMWQMNEDGSGAFKMDEDTWVKKQWRTTT